MAITFYRPRNITEEMFGVPGAPETCFRCHVDLMSMLAEAGGNRVLARDLLDAALVCVDECGNEYDHHLDEPIGAGL